MFTINKPKGPPTIVSDRRLYLAEDKRTVVDEGDPRARYLLVGAGSEILEETADDLGLEFVDGKFVLPQVAEAEELEQRAPATDSAGSGTTTPPDGSAPAGTPSQS